MNESHLWQVDLNVCFPEYTGGCSYFPAVEFIEEQFRNAAGVDREEVYVHTTCATDTDQMEKLFDTVESIVLEANVDQLL